MDGGVLARAADRRATTNASSYVRGSHERGITVGTMCVLPGQDHVRVGMLFVSRWTPDVENKDATSTVN